LFLSHFFYCCIIPLSLVYHFAGREEGEEEQRDTAGAMQCYVRGRSGDAGFCSTNHSRPPRVDYRGREVTYYRKDTGPVTTYVHLNMNGTAAGTRLQLSASPVWSIWL
jgi:hypothetical protein